MKNIIYYFTGTGNSLMAAKNIAEKLGNTELVRITKHTPYVNFDEYDRVGIVYPVYFYGLPKAVKEFVDKLKINKKTYLFSVATCGGSTGVAMRQLTNSLKFKDIKLSAAFHLVLPDNYQVLYEPPNKEKQNKLFEKSEEKLISIMRKISNKEIVKFHESGKYMSKIIGALVYIYFTPATWDKNFWTDDKCNGCGSCAKVCPVNDITMEQGRPHWKNHCEHCLACMQWCPQRAIQYKKRTENRKRYHNPYINIKELQ